MIGHRWLRWLGAGIAGAAVLVVGGTYFYIHVIEGPPPAPLTLSGASPSVSPSTAPSAGRFTTNGEWKVAAGSTAGYRVKEILFGQSTTAVGRTSEITGSVTISGTSVTAGSFEANTTTLASDQSGRDGQVQGRILETNIFPTAGFTLTAPIALTTLAEGIEASGTATGLLDLHGVKAAVHFVVKAKRAGPILQVTGSIPITFADYNIANPSGGPAQTGDTGTLEFLLALSKV